MGKTYLGKCGCYEHDHEYHDADDYGPGRFGVGIPGYGSHWIQSGSHLSYWILLFVDRSLWLYSTFESTDKSSHTPADKCPNTARHGAYCFPFHINPYFDFQAVGTP